MRMLVALIIVFTAAVAAIAQTPAINASARADQLHATLLQAEQQMPLCLEDAPHLRGKLACVEAARGASRAFTQAQISLYALLIAREERRWASTPVIKAATEDFADQFAAYDQQRLNWMQEYDQVIHMPQGVDRSRRLENLSEEERTLQRNRAELLAKAKQSLRAQTGDQAALDMRRSSREMWRWLEREVQLAGEVRMRYYDAREAELRSRSAASEHVIEPVIDPLPPDQP